MSRLTGAGGSWNPRRLGRSLPFYRELWISRGVIGGLILLLAVVFFVRGRSRLDPEVERLDAAAAERLVKGHLAKVADDLPKWTPGGELPPTEAPEWMRFPAPEPWPRGLPAEPPLRGRAAELAADGRRDLAAGNPQAAATRLLRAVELQPQWGLLFTAATALGAVGDHGRALATFLSAEERLEALERSGVDGADLHAARIATRYAAGRAALAAGDCLAAIPPLRRAVAALGAYIDAEGAMVYDRKQPFRVREAGLDNHAVWATLAEAYATCEGRFPAEYPSYYGAQSFAGEYRRADDPEIVGGAFPAGLAACVDAGDPSSRCWAWSNLNKVLQASRDYLPGENGEPTRRLDGVLLDSFARLVYDAAWLGATSDQEADRALASRYLTAAAHLDREAEVPELATRIAALGRYLAPLTGDNSALAEPYRRQSLDDVILEAGLPPEALKGIGWALSERWLDQLQARQPEAMLAAIDEQVRRAGPHGESLRQWRSTLQEAMRQRLAAEITTLRRNDDPASALAIRDFHADWLGEEWPSTARRAWIDGRMILGWLGLALLFLALAGGLWLFHRLVVYPYLLYTTDYYRREHRRRHAERAKDGKPFTRDELERAGF